MPEIKIDNSLCSGCGTCEAMCPDCFHVGDDMKAHLKKGLCESCNLKEVAEDCPMGAIVYE